MPVVRNLHLGHGGEAYPDAFYVRLGEHRFTSTLHAQGAWQPGEQHLAPASGLLLAEVERHLPSDKLVSRASFDVVVYHSAYIYWRTMELGSTLLQYRSKRALASFQFPS